MKLALAGGGTGGHLFPGLAVAEAARTAGLAEETVFFGSERGIEARAVPAAGYELVASPLAGLRGASLAGRASALLLLARGVAHVRGELERRAIDAVIGLGGYASAPAVIAARTAGIPVVLLEQNRVAGMANRLLARLARCLCSSFEETEVGGCRTVWTGNPVRAEIEAAAGRSAEEREELLVLGGSGGARSLNRAVAGALRQIAGELRLPALTHQSGERWLEETRALYEGSGIEARPIAFADDIATLYARARLVVGRAGATTIAELIATGTPAVLLPYPHAAEHQLDNARSLEAAGAAIVIHDDEQCQARLADTLLGLLRSPERIHSMAGRMRTLRRPGAAQRVLDVVRGTLKMN